MLHGGICLKIGYPILCDDWPIDRFRKTYSHWRSMPYFQHRSGPVFLAPFAGSSRGVYEDGDQGGVITAMLTLGFGR
jgi:hypothetical protein